MKCVLALMLSVLFLCACKKNSDTPVPPPAPDLAVSSVTVNGVSANSNSFTNVNLNPSIKILFNAPLDRNSVQANLAFVQLLGNSVAYNLSYERSDSTLVIKPTANLSPLSKYSLVISAGIQSVQNKKLNTTLNILLRTAIDSTDKFPVLSDSALLDLVQGQTFKYFWDFAHPVSGLARERNTSGETVTTGGSGFGIMSVLAAVNRKFITRAQGLARLQTTVSFLKNTAKKFHGAFPHWMNGTTGDVIPFSANDNGADLVETSYLMEGLLCARQFFNGSTPEETALVSDINILWNGVEWDWFRKNNENVLYWHWSPNLAWIMNFPIHGWNEALITYVLAASSATHSIPKIVYDNGWAQNGAMKNNAVYYGYTLPLGPAFGGPLFFSHYSFLGINPFSLSDAYANYQTQVINHTKINYEYCKANPKGFYGYGDQCWGLTASDIPNGYTASSPTNDVGVIAPTAAISSLPYTPTESMAAIRFFYYKLGDKLWGTYGFMDAFSLNDAWFSNSYLAIDQGPEVVMIENYRSQLFWKLFMSCPEVKSGMKNLGFQSPNL